MKLVGKLTEPSNSGFWNRWPLDGWCATNPEKPLFVQFFHQIPLLFLAVKF
jgi:hypothetical protein